MQHGTIEFMRDAAGVSWLVIHEVHTDKHRPYRIHYYWPIHTGSETSLHDQYDIGGKVEKEAFSYSWTYRLQSRPGYVHFKLPEGGKTKALLVREEEIPCPKVRKGIETKWSTYHGKWMKLLKKGWEPA